jgi:hypothetical protein
MAGLGQSLRGPARARHCGDGPKEETRTGTGGSSAALGPRTQAAKSLGVLGENLQGVVRVFGGLCLQASDGDRPLNGGHLLQMGIPTNFAERMHSVPLSRGCKTFYTPGIRLDRDEVSHGRVQKY